MYLYSLQIKGDSQKKNISFQSCKALFVTPYICDINVGLALIIWHRFSVHFGSERSESINLYCVKTKR
jgi:hypothetical protein